MPQSIGQKILVILPCHNEEGRIEAVVCAVSRTLPEATVAVINDDSTDATAKEARDAGALVLPHAVNLGYGAALETGYLFAAQRGYDIVVQMDGDGQHRAEDLPVLIGPILDGSADIVIGSRYLDTDFHYHSPLARRIGQWIFAAAVRLLTRRRITDPTSGFQALNRRAIAFFASGVFPCDYPDADVVTMSCMAGLRIQEVPAHMIERRAGTFMHSGLRPIYYAMKMSLAIFIVVLNYRIWRNWRRAAQPAAT